MQIRDINGNAWELLVVVADRLAKVVMVEDNPDEIFLTKTLMQEEGIHIDFSFFHDGEAFLSHFMGEAARQSGVKLPDLILLDLNLPKIDGRTLLRTIKDSETLHSVPVAILSGSTMPEDMEVSIELGACLYLVKPFNPDALYEVTGHIASLKVVERQDGRYLLNCA